MEYLSVYVKPGGETIRKVQKTSSVSVKVKHVTQLCKYTCIYFEGGEAEETGQRTYSTKEFGLHLRADKEL